MLELLAPNRSRRHRHHDCRCRRKAIARSQSTDICSATATSISVADAHFSAARGTCTCGCWLWAWRNRERNNVEIVDACEISRVAGVDREIVGDRRRRDHRVVRARCGLTAYTPQTRRDSAERSRRARIKRERIEVRLSLLQMRLTRGTLPLIPGNQRTNRQLRQRDRRDQGLGWEQRRVLEARQKNDSGGIQNAARMSLGSAHRPGSITLSISRLSAPGSRAGRWRQRSTSASEDNPGRESGRSSATRLPALVIVISSPRAARSTTSPPRLRRSLMLTSVIQEVYHA